MLLQKNKQLLNQVHADRNLYTSEHMLRFSYTNQNAKAAFESLKQEHLPPWASQQWNVMAKPLASLPLNNNICKCVCDLKFFQYPLLLLKA